jgi:hypothetical protein
MSTLAEVENAIHDAGGNDTLAIARPETGGKVGSLSRAAARWWRRRRNQRYDFAAFAHFNPFALFHPVKDGAEVMPDLPDGRGLHVAQ